MSGGNSSEELLAESQRRVEEAQAKVSQAAAPSIPYPPVAPAAPVAPAYPQPQPPPQFTPQPGPYPPAPAPQPAPTPSNTIAVLEALHAQLEQYRPQGIYPDTLRQATVNEIQRLRMLLERMMGLMR
jgi:hypothetical protein